MIQYVCATRDRATSPHPHSGLVNGGWLGRVCTALHLLHHTSLTAPAHLLFGVFFAFSIHGSFVSSWSPTWDRCRRCICEPSMDKTLKECVKADVADSYSGSWLYELADPELTALYAESQEVDVSITTLLES